MKRNSQLLILGVLVCASASFAQGTLKQSTDQAETTKDPVAYVYVSSSPTGTYNQIEAYSAASDGKLSLISGSPFNANVTGMVVDGKYLFGSTLNGIDIDTYSIESDGALHNVVTKDVVKYNSGDCGYSGPLFLDRTGTSLYDFELYGDCSNNFYESFSLNKSSGKLRNLGGVNGGAWLSSPAAFIGNNKYAYSASCLNDMYWAIFGFRRSSDGLLSSINFNVSVPAAKAEDLLSVPDCR
jgi:hypothetical protein